MKNYRLNNLGPMDGSENEVRKTKGRRNAIKPRKLARKSKTGQRNADAMTLTSFNTAVQISESGINSNPPPSGTPPSLALQSFNFPMYPGSHPLLAHNKFTIKKEYVILLIHNTFSQLECVLSRGRKKALKQRLAGAQMPCG